MTESLEPAATAEEKAWGLVKEQAQVENESTSSELSDGEFPELGSIFQLAKKSCSASSKTPASLNTSVDSGDHSQDKVNQMDFSSFNSVSAQDEDSNGSDSEDIPMSPRSLGLSFI